LGYPDTGEIGNSPIVVANICFHYQQILPRRPVNELSNVLGGDCVGDLHLKPDIQRGLS
jgi:hypothetical protein